MTIFLIVLAFIYFGGYLGFGLFVWLLGGGVWKAVPDALIVGAVWPYVIWDWTR